MAVWTDYSGLSTANMDDAADDPSQARAELKAVADAVIFMGTPANHPPTKSGTETISGDWNHTGNLQKSGVSLTTPSVVSNFTGSQNSSTRSPALTNPTVVDLVALIAAGVTESFGPTSSTVTTAAAAHNIWTALDAVPANAKSITVVIDNQASVYNSVLAWAFIQSAWCANSGDSATVPDTATEKASSIFARSYVGTTSAQANDIGVTHEVKIPIDSNRRFNIRRNTTTLSSTGTPTGAYYVNMYLKGWDE